MKIMLTAGVCLLLLASAAGQQPAVPSGQKSGSELENKVRAVWEGFQKKDKAAVAGLLDESFRTLSSGDSKFGDKKSEVAEVDEFTLDQYTLSDFHIQRLGPSAALVTYMADYSGKSGGQPVHTRGIFGEVWSRRGRDWKCMYAQETDLH